MRVQWLAPDLFQQRVSPFFQQRISPFIRARTTTTDQQTRLLAGSYRHVLGVHHKASPRARCHRYYCPQDSGRIAAGTAGDWRGMRGRGSWMEWRAQSRRVTLTTCMDDARHAHNLSHDVVCKSWRPEPDYWTMRTWDHACINSRVVRVLVVTLSLVSCVLSLGFTTHTQYQVWSSFLLDFVFQLCICYQTYTVIVNFICNQILAHFYIAKTGQFEVLSLQQLHVAIQTLWSQCLFPRAAWTNRWIVHFQQVSPCLFDLRLRFRVRLSLNVQ